VEYGRLLEVKACTVVLWLISIPRADARDLFRSKRVHSSSQVNGVSEGNLSGC
jgi:hypothetical protein